MSKYYNEDYKDFFIEELIDTEVIAGSGGGGCFPAGTLVRTAHGTKPIETFLPGDMILAYDRFGEVDFALVSNLHIHKKETYLDDLYYIYAGEVSLFPLGITGNHAVFDLVSNEHKEISEFKIGDKVLNLAGLEVEITAIAITPNADLASDFAVYNLTVEPQHTFLVGSDKSWVRVHNGGGGKSGGGAAHAAQEAPNTLRSSSIAKVLEVLSYGPIVGVNGGAKGIYFNNTIVQNPDNSYNFNGVTYQERTGTPSQTFIPGFNSIESEVVLTGTVVTVAAPVTEQLPDTNISVVRATVRLNEGLWAQNTSNGDLNGYTVSYQIAYRTSLLGSWNTVVNKTISDKSTTPYEIAHRISAPSGSFIHSIRVTRISPDDTTSATKSIISFPRLTEIIEEVKTYNNIALSGITIPASSVGNQIPTRAYDVSGIMVKVPANYNPITRAYSGSYWSGAFAGPVAWTDNPAWILYDLITNTDYGMATFLNQPIDVDIFSFFEAAMYNDCVSWNGSAYTTSLITDGNGGTEVRYKFNAVIATQSDAWQLLHAVASNMRALLVMKGTQISILQDRPRASSKIITTSNVLDGLFLYAGTEVTSRGTAINCTFNNRLDRYLPRTITEQDNISISKYGYNVKDIVAFGCVDESQARRMAKWALYTEIHQPESVTFSMALNIVDMAVGQVVSVLDENYISDTNTYATGKLVSALGTTVILDKPITISAGVTYTFGLMSLDYSEIISYSITTTAAVDIITLTLGSAVAAGDYTNYDYFCYSTGTPNPETYLIQSIAESSHGIYAITCIKYDGAKYGIIELGLSAIPPVYKVPFASSLPAVTNITFNEVYMNDGIASHNYIGVNWLWDSIAKEISTITHVGAVATVTSIAHGYVNGNSISISGIVNEVLYNGIFKIDGVTANTFTYTMSGTPSANAIVVGSIFAVKDLHTSKDVVTYNLRWRRDGNDYRIVTNLTTKDFHIPDTTPGNYEITIEAINLQGKKSLATYSTYDYRITAGTSTLLPPTNFYVINTVGTVFTDTHIGLVWSYPVANDTKTDTLLDYVLETWYGLETTPRRTYIITPDIGTKDGSFDYSLANNINDYGSPSRSVTFKLYSRDMVGDKSNALAQTFTNVVPSHNNFSFTLVNGLASAYLHITQSVDEPDITGYIVAQNSTATLVGAALSDVGRNLLPTFSAAGPMYYAIAAYDSFGKTGLDYSSFIAGNPLSFNVDRYTFAGLHFTPNSPSVNSITWTAFTVSKNGSAILTSIATGNLPWTIGQLYVCYDDATHAVVSTTDLGVAVGYAQVLATYRGGIDLASGDGSAFIDGGQVVAGSVAANKLVAHSLTANELSVSTAVISVEAQIGAAVINNAAIKDYIQSANYNATTFNGWKLDKAGNLTSYGAVRLYDGLGNTVLSTGTAAAIEWAKVAGTGRPANNADVTGSNIAAGIAGQGIFATAGQITPANVSTYIANLAVKTAQIDNLAVNTLQLAGNAVGFQMLLTLPAVNFSGTVGAYAVTAWVTLGSISVPMSGGTANSTLSITPNFVYDEPVSYPSTLRVQIIDSSSVIVSPIGSSVAFNTNVTKTYYVRARVDASVVDYASAYGITISGSLIFTGAKSSV
jgi:predicted phage tail protein